MPRLVVLSAALVASHGFATLWQKPFLRRSSRHGHARRASHEDEGPLPEEVPQFALNAKARAKRRKLLARNSKATQLLIGDAIGDAFGAIIEMQDAYWIRSSVNFDSWPKNPMRRTQWDTNQACGMYTDDCEMTVGLMNGLVEHGLDLREDDMLQAWQAEWDLARERPRPNPPGAERSGHGSIKVYFRGFRNIEEIRRSQACKEDPGNAPPMRALPLAFIDDPDTREKLCIRNANSTHPHPRALAASFIMAEGARFMMMEDGKKSQVIKECLSRLRKSSVSNAATEEHLERLDELEDYHSFGHRFAEMSPDVLELLCGPQPCPPAAGLSCGEDGKSRMNGLWSDAMRTSSLVLYLLKHHRGPLDILRAAVDVGGDVDSAAALCLGVVGGSSGLKLGKKGGLPWFLVEELEGVEYLAARARKFEAWIEKQQE